MMNQNNQYGNVPYYPTDVQQNQQHRCSLSFPSPSPKNAEFIHDKCTLSIYALDNSGSMGEKDAKMFIDGKLIQHVSRWDEAVQRVRKIAQYNIERGQNAAYYLLNPQNFGTWVPGIDVVQIPANGGNLQQLTPLLNSRNIRGNTPLTNITNYITNELIARMKNPGVHSYDPVCYNLITDGMPNNRNSFTKSLRNMIHPSADMALSIFITVNLCTDDENLIEFYNDLDTKLGNECCGLDVIDDWIGEANEIEKLNPFLTYSELLHTSRMSGCYNKIWDEIDEKNLTPTQIHSLILEIFPNIALPNFRDKDNLKAYRTVLEKEVQNYGKVQNSKGKYELPLNTSLAIDKIFPIQNGCQCTIL